MPIQGVPAGIPANPFLKIEPVSKPQFASKPQAAAPLRFLETRDLFFSSHSIRASIDPFLNDSTQKTLYLMFEQKGGFLKRIGRAPNAAIVLEKSGANITVNTAQYRPDDTVLGALFTPGLETFYWMEKPITSWWQQLLQRWVGAGSDEQRIRLPQAQEGVVQDMAAEKTYKLQGGDKGIRTQLRDDVLAAVSALEDAGYQLQNEQMIKQPTAANPFNVALTLGEKALQPV